MLSDNTVEGMLILGAPFIVMGVTAYLISMAVIRHRERMEKIKRGIDPDAPGNQR
jgi:hypothetical protein